MKNYIDDIAKIKKKDRYNAITKVIEENGIKYRVQTLPNNNSFGNIIVEFNPEKKGKIVVSAHYDNAYGTPGANDNAAACSILLNLILNNKDTNNHIEFVFFDLEEIGFYGSKYYVKENSDSDILYAINLDMCGLGSNILYACYNPINNSDIKIKEMNDSNVYKMEILPPGDALTFADAGITTFFIVNSTNHDLEWYRQFANRMEPKSFPDFLKTMHLPTDTVETINYEQVEKIYKFTSSLLSKLCEIREMIELPEDNEEFVAFIPKGYCLMEKYTGSVVDWGKIEDNLFLQMAEDDIPDLYALMTYEIEDDKTRSLTGKMYMLDESIKSEIKFKGKYQTIYFNHEFKDELMEEQNKYKK